VAYALAKHEDADRYQRAIDDPLWTGAFSRYGTLPGKDLIQNDRDVAINALPRIGVDGAPIAASTLGS
jgi:hypothetical protein